jgi:hypothetical protein
VIDVEVERMPANGSYGMVIALFRNDARFNLNDVIVDCAFPREGLMEVVPEPEVGCYYSTVRAADPMVRSRFLVLPNEAETGRTYTGVVRVSHVDADGNRRIHERQQFDIRLEPRPEIYFAIGVADTVRRLGLAVYTQMVNAGREAHERDETVLPDFANIEDPAKVLMGEETFSWAMSMIQLGTRIYNSQMKK